MGEPIIVITTHGRMELWAVLRCDGGLWLIGQPPDWQRSDFPAVMQCPLREMVVGPSEQELERLVGRGLTTDMLAPSPAGRVRYVDAAEMAALRFGPNQVAPSIPREPETVTQLRHELAAKAAIAEAERADALKGARKEIFIGWADGFLRDIRRLAYLPKIEFGTADLFMLDNLLRDAGYKLPEDVR